MTWLRDGFDFLREHLAPVTTKVGERWFSNKTFTEIKPKLDPLPAQFEVSTLAALRDLIKANVEGISSKGDQQPLVHIVDYQNVNLLLGVSDSEGRRLVFARAKPTPYTGFQFDTYLGLEKFRIGVQAHFTDTPDREYVLQMASRVTDGDVAIAEDDGVSQQVTVKATIALKETEKLRARVSLAPFRTFPEVDQPQSEFIFRARKNQQNGSELALFEGDGGKWKLDAIEKIRLELKVLGIDLPIIA